MPLKVWSIYQHSAPKVAQSVVSLGIQCHHELKKKKHKLVDDISKYCIILNGGYLCQNGLETFDGSNKWNNKLAGS